MRNRMSVVLMVVAMAACHPRYAPLGDGVGGSGGLNTIRVKIIAAIAARDYEHARHLVQLAVDMSQEEQARFEQMISAAERRLVPFLEKALSHIFRLEDGHFPVDTAETRELLQTTAIEENFVGLRVGGVRVYQRLLETGEQIWVYVFKGTIRDGGCNDVPRTVSELLK